MRQLFLVGLLVLVSLQLAVPLVGAHEAYVLNGDEITSGIELQSPNPFMAISGNEMMFLVWSVIIALVIFIVLKVSISPLFEKVFAKLLKKLKVIAPFIVRLTLSGSLLTSAYFGSAFGPELSFSSILTTQYALPASIIFGILGICLLIGWRTREAALLTFFIYIYVLAYRGFYGMTYLGYLGASIFLIITGAGLFSIDSRTKRDPWRKIVKNHEDQSFLVLRVLFGLSIMFSAFYAKFLHSNLALYTVNKYHLTAYFHFSPLFVVLGAFLVEILVGLMLALGFEIRFFSIVFIVFLTLSINFFGEAVWPHIILFGTSIALLLHGYDNYTLEKALFQKKRRGEPVL